MATKPIRLADVMHQECETIVGAWTAAGGHSSFSYQLSRQQLRDHLPILLMSVADIAAKAETAENQAYPHPAVLQELRMRFDIEQFMQEYGLLKRVAFTRLASVVGKLDGEEVLQVNRGFDLVLLEMVKVYTRSVVQFTGILSHDLRSPLQAIAGAAELLRRQVSKDQQQRQLIVSILNAGKRAGRLIDDMLDFSQIRLGGLSMSPADTDLYELAQDVVNEVRLGHPERSIELHREGDSKGCWDAGRIAQVMVNLLRNAVHYSPPQANIRMTIRDAGSAITLSVHNDGPPIPEELRPYLFLPMVYGIAQERPGRGLGLGLYIVKRIVAGHGGTVDVRSTEAEGTTFTVTLPRTLAGK